MINTKKLAGKTVFITGASRGIGKAIGLKAARDGANVVIASKTTVPHHKLDGTIYTAAKEMEDAGGCCLPCHVDVRREDQVKDAVESAVEAFGGIDILVNNASAIHLSGTVDTPMRKYDLLSSINTRGTFLVSKYCIPHLKKSTNAHILNISPPLLMEPRWFESQLAYTIAKYGMSMCVLGMAKELKNDNIAVNALWPKTVIATAATEMLGGKGIHRKCRKPDIMADAAYAVFQGRTTGQFYIDELILKDHGVKDFDQYVVDPSESLLANAFIPESLLKLFASNECVASYKQAAKKEFSSPLSLVGAVFDKIKFSLNPEVAQKTSGVFAFHITDGAEKEIWHIDMKNAAGSVGKGDPPTGQKADVTITSDIQTFMDMFSGKLKPTSALLAGKLKLEGDVNLAMKLEKLVSNMKSKL